MRVLLVDDDDSLRRALVRTLHRARFEVEAFKSVEALLVRGVPEHDACLVLDVDLPGIGGIEFKHALAQAGRDLPTIFITALEPAEVSEPLAALAPVAVLYKPFNKKDLLEAIERAGDQRHCAQDAPARPRRQPLIQNKDPDAASPRLRPHGKRRARLQ